jgi:hypothetical protein
MDTRRATLETRGPLAWVAGLAGVVTWICFVVLAITGFYAVVQGGPITGYVLLLHVGFGGAFAVALLVLVLFRSDSFSFDLTAPGVPVAAVRKIFFWLFAASSVSLMLSSAMMMMPLMGTHGQELLLIWHRWSAYAATAFVLLYLVAWFGKRRRA